MAILERAAQFGVNGVVIDIANTATAIYPIDYVLGQVRAGAIRPNRATSHNGKWEWAVPGKIRFDVAPSIVTLPDGMQLAAVAISDDGLILPAGQEPPPLAD